MSVREGEAAAPLRSGMVVPPPVLAGGRVAIVAPAGPMLADRLEAGLQPLRAAGYDLVMRDDLTARHRRFLAGDDARRLEELAGALLDPAIDAVVAVRGGYGTMRLLPALAAQVPPGQANPKRVTGFSDITALHAFVGTHLGWASLHSPMPFNFSAEAPDDAAAVAQSAAGLVSALQAPVPRSGPVSVPLIPVRPGRARGRLIGGNLTLVEAMFRSPWLPSMEGALLFVEDVGEEPYRLDRLVTALRLRGAADEVAGVVVGSFTGCGGTPDEAAAEVGGLFQGWGVPVARGLRAGHRHPNDTLWLGVEHELDATQGRLTVLPTPRLA